MSNEESLIEMEDPRYPAPEGGVDQLELSVLHAPHGGSSGSASVSGGAGGGASELSKRNSSERSLPLRSYSKWSPTEQGATLVWRDLCVYTAGQNGSSASLYNMKRIINNSTGAVQPGNLMAIMGSRCVCETYLIICLM